MILKMRKIINSKRSQEEMVGFVLIIVLVAVIALVFLAISMRKPVGMTRSYELQAFLQSSLSVTTECKQNPLKIYDFKDLIGACYKNEVCLSGKTACEVLDYTAKDLIENSFRIDKSGEYKSYEFEINAETGNILSLERGEKKGSKIGGNAILQISGEKVNITLILYH